MGSAVFSVSPTYSNQACSRPSSTQSVERRNLILESIYTSCLFQFNTSLKEFVFHSSKLREFSELNSKVNRFCELNNFNKYSKLNELIELNKYSKLNKLRNHL